MWKPNKHNAAACAAAAACSSNVLKPSFNAPAAAQPRTSTARSSSPAERPPPEAQGLQLFISALKLDISLLPHPIIATKTIRPGKATKQEESREGHETEKRSRTDLNTLGQHNQKPTLLLKVRKNRVTIEIPCLKASRVEPQLSNEGRTTRNGSGNDKRRQSTGDRGNQAGSQHEETNINGRTNLHGIVNDQASFRIFRLVSFTRNGASSELDVSLTKRAST